MRVQPNAAWTSSPLRDCAMPLAPPEAHAVPPRHVPRPAQRTRAPRTQLSLSFGPSDIDRRGVRVRTL